MIKVSGGRISMEKVPQTWSISLYYDVKVKVLIDSPPEEGRPLLVLSHESLLIVKLEARLASLWKNKVKDCLLIPVIRALPGQREDWRLIHASHIKCKTQCNPNYCTAMTHLSSLFPIHHLCWVFHMTRSKLRMPALSLPAWSREGQRHGDAYLFCPWMKCSAP